MESQTLTSATLSRSDSVGSLLNERSYDAETQSPSTLRLRFSPKLESDLPYSSDNQHDKNQIDTDKSEKIFLLPGTERIVKVIKKFTISDNNNKEYTERDNEEVYDSNINDADNEQDLNSFIKNQYTNKTEHKYYKTNVVHKRHRVLHRSNRSHHERHHRRHQKNQSIDYINGLQSSEQSQSPVRRETIEKSKNIKYKKPVTSFQSSVTYDPYSNEQKRVISRLNLIAPGPAKSSDLNENEVMSTDGFHDTSRNVQKYLNSQNTKVGLSELKESRLFLPIKTNKKNRNKYKNHSRRSEYESHHEKLHSSLNRLYPHTSHNSGVCRKCNVMCSKCNESIHHLNHYNSESRSLHRADMYCDRRLRGISCSSSLDHECRFNSSQRYRSLSGSKLFIPSSHHHHYQPHRHICCAKSIPSLSTLDFYDTNSIYTHSLGSNRHVNFIEIEYMQNDNGDNDNENLPMGLTKDKLNWITNLARESLIKTKDLDSLAKLMKETLDEHFGKIWHSIVGTESYGSHLATLPGTLVSFRIDKWAFLLWQT
ncbi:unnamed protein product [Schistosoma rodhaini]|uniref:Dynein light chain n=1 Tax=Schistosoma rodhaini TaxID=6188 RepID=A0A183RLM3_9TREM|nr:unnamed protein product [Schistosoma rodhaini]